jgi:CheY-like chemotaxis protein
MSVILHIDDEKVIRILYKEVFEERGYKVIQASSGEEALDLLSERSPDLIILDLKMRGIGGRGFLEEFRRLNLDIPVVVSTAYPHEMQELVAQSADAYVVKSGDMTELVDMVDGLLAKVPQA